jgi:hypothetical protein
MPSVYRHLFIELDIQGLIEASGNQPPSKQLVRQYSTLYDQGSETSGDPEKRFEIGVDTGDQVYITIVPKVLKSYSMLYCTEFNVTEQTTEIELPDDILVGDHDLTFVVPIISAKKGGMATFEVSATLQYMVAGVFAEIPLVFDPVLRANQGHTIDVFQAVI